METSKRASRCTLWHGPLPQTPTFPIPWVLSLGAGVGLDWGCDRHDSGVYRQSIRTEKDAAACTDLPLLISVPWLGNKGKWPRLRTEWAPPFLGKGDRSAKDQERLSLEHVYVQRIFWTSSQPVHVNPDPRYLYLTRHTEEALACLTTVSRAARVRAADRRSGHWKDDADQ